MATAKARHHRMLDLPAPPTDNDHRHDQEQAAKLDELKALMTQGVASGVSSRSDAVTFRCAAPACRSG